MEFDGIWVRVKMTNSSETDGFIKTWNILWVHWHHCLTDTHICIYLWPRRKMKAQQGKKECEAQLNKASQLAGRTLRIPGFKSFPVYLRGGMDTQLLISPQLAGKLADRLCVSGS